MPSIRSFLLPVLCLCLITQHTFAACQSKGGEPLFSCTVQNGKHLEICARHGGIEYSFGKSISNPEMHFILSRHESYYEFIRGPYWENVNLFMPINNVIYVLTTRFSTQDRGYHDLIVYINRKKRATLSCKPASINDNINEDILFESSREASENDPLIGFL